MSVGAVLIGLQAWRVDGRGVTTEEFVAPLEIQPGEVESARADGSEEPCGMVYFAVINHSEFSHVDTSADAGAQTEAFFAEVLRAFCAAATFFDKRSPNVTAAMRSSGLSLQIFIEIRMDQDQMELEFPPEFLAACGRHKLKMYVISNDISAYEAWEALQRA